MNSHQRRRRRRVFLRYMRLPIHDRIVGLLTDCALLEMRAQMRRAVEAEFMADMERNCPGLGSKAKK